MAKYNGLTQKQMQMLEPLERSAKDNRKRRDRLQKRLAFEQTLGFEENKAVHKEIEELDTEYREFSTKIAEIYGAHDEMMAHMKIAIAEVKKVDALKDKYGFDISN